MEMQFRPITVWPGQILASKDRRRAQFKSPYSATLALLDRELGYLKAKSLVLQVALQEEDIRLDGRPRAGSKPTHPGVILAFDSKFGPLSYPCDTFTIWEDNLRAIALGLEHLRAVDRYGVTRRGEQYRGWAQLPAPAVTMDKVQAIKFLQAYSISVIGSKEDAQAAYRVGAFRLHPDRGGNPDEFKKLQQAKSVLEL
jgi:hypothetical protein